MHRPPDCPGGIWMMLIRSLSPLTVLTVEIKIFDRGKFVLAASHIDRSVVGAAKILKREVSKQQPAGRL